MPQRYQGQGKQLPSEMGQGVWICENRVMLRTDLPPKESPLFATYDLEAARLNSHGGLMVTFRAVDVAAGMGITVADLLRANQEGELSASFQDVDPPAGAVAATKFILRYGDRAFSMTAAVRQTGGRA